MKKSKIHFIVNPISGKGKGEELIAFINKYFSQNLQNLQNNEIDYLIKVTQKKEDANEMTKLSIKEGAEIVVSCGGDGTLNEVASALINSDIFLGIIPIGSGNGLARNLKIPMNYKNAFFRIIDFISELNEKKYNKEFYIDCGEILIEKEGKIDKLYFFSNMGFGFDASVIKTYMNQKKRQLLGYIKSILISAFSFRSVSLEIQTKTKNENEVKIIKDDFMMFLLSNSNCMGYFFSLTPKASLSDGYLDIIGIKKCNYILFSFLIIKALFKNFKSKRFVQFTSDNLIINKKVSYIQFDGEFIEIFENILKIGVIKKAIKVIPGK